MTIWDTRRESMLRRSTWNNSADYQVATCSSAFCIANVIFMTAYCNEQRTVTSSTVPSLYRVQACLNASDSNSAGFPILAIFKLLEVLTYVCKPSSTKIQVKSTKS